MDRTDAENIDKKLDSNDNPATISSGAQELGHRAHANAAYMQTPQATLLYRNLLRTAVAVVPTAVAFAGTRHFFHAYRKSDTSGPLHDWLKNTKLVEDSTYIFTGFLPFRALCKVWNRNYDRIFNPNGTEQDSARAIDQLPANVVSDFKEVLPPEIIGNALSASVLAAVKTGFKSPEPSLKNNFAQVTAGWSNDWLSSVAAYIPFFELNDRVYDAVSGGKDTPAYYAKLQGRSAPEKLPENGKYAFFTQDGLGKVGFQRVGGLLMGIAPYIASQRMIKSKLGLVNPSMNSYVSDVMREYCTYLPFAFYPATQEVYNRKYEELFSQLEAKESHAK